MHTNQPKQKLFEVDLKTDSTAIVFQFVFVATSTHIYTRCGNVHAYIHLGLRPHLLDFHVRKGGGPRPNQKHRNKVPP